MAARPGKKQIAEQRALLIASRLAPYLRKKPSERQWTIDAGVSPSFFSNLRGTPTKPPSEPSVGVLGDVLAAVGVTLSEFFLPESRARVAPVPTRQELERAIGEALEQLPKKAVDRPQYLAEAVLKILALPPDRPATLSGAVSEETDAPEEGALPRVATKRA